MRRLRLYRLRLPRIVPLIPLVFAAHLTLPQERLSASKAPTQRPNLAAQFAAVPEDQIYFHPGNENLSLTFASNEGQTPLQFSRREIGYHASPTNNALPELWQPPEEVDGLRVKTNHFIGNALTEWLTDVMTHNMAHYRRPDQSGDVQYYGHHIPWADRIILSIGEQARFHPRVTRVFELIEPRGVRLENRLPRPAIRR